MPLAIRTTGVLSSYAATCTHAPGMLTSTAIPREENAQRVSPGPVAATAKQLS